MATAEIVTLLFTDLVGSTELLQRLGDDAAETVRRTHFQLLRDAVHARGGHEVKNLGDGLMVVFPSALDAIACAVAIQQAVQEHNKQGKKPPFAVRVGLQVGEPVRDEDDYFGRPVVVAKRLCDAARGGQILATQLVTGLVGSRGGFRFRSMGRLQLTGITEALSAVEVKWDLDEPPRASGRPAGRRSAPPASARGPKLVGREPEVARLDAELKRVASGLRCVLVLGEAGVGKTRLVSELAARSRVLALFARAFPLGETTAFGVWSEALERHLGGLGPDEVLDLCGGFLDDLAAVLHSAAAVRGSAPEREPPRLRLLDGLATILRNLAKGGPIIVVLDDVHLADASSWDALRYLANQLSEAPILVLLIARPVELAQQSSANPVLFALEQDGLLERIQLMPLDPSGIAALAEEVLGERPPAALSRWLADRSRGNALFAHGLLRALLEEGADLSAPVLRRLPENLAERVKARLADLDPTSVEILEVLAAVGRQVELTEFAHLAGQSVEELEGVLGRLTSSRLVVEEERDGKLLYESGHPLIAEAIYQNVGGVRRRRLHRTIARGLRTHGRLTEAASHFARSGDVGDEEAIEVLRDAVRQAEDREAYRESLTILGALVELLPSGDKRWLEVADAISWDAQWVIERRAGIDAAMGIKALREIDAVLDHHPDPGLQARVKSRLTNFLAYGTGDFDDAEEVCRASLALFEQAGDRAGILRASLELSFVLTVKGDLPAWEVGSRSAFEAAEASGERALAMEASWHAGIAAAWRGRFSEAQWLHGRSLEIARNHGTRYPVAFRLEILALDLAMEGRADEASAPLAEANSLYPSRPGGLLPEWDIFRQWMFGNFPAATGSSVLALEQSPTAMSKTRAIGMAIAALAAVENDDLGTAREHVGKADAVYGDRDWFFYRHYCLYAHAMIAWREGRQLEALAALRTVTLKLVGMEARPPAAFTLIDLVELAVESGEIPTASEAASNLTVLAGEINRDLYQGLAALGNAYTTLGSGDPRGAAEAAGNAVDLLGGLGYRCVLGRTHAVLGRSLIGTDQTRAVQTLKQAAEIFDSCGARWRQERTIETLRTIRGRGEKAAAALLGPGSLTKREREVARLAVQGLTAKEIAKQLILGPRTVEGHLANVYAKLGVRSKVDLIRRAQDLGI